jgi:hypothetical protein
VYLEKPCLKKKKKGVEKRTERNKGETRGGIQDMAFKSTAHSRRKDHPNKVPPS